MFGAAAAKEVYMAGYARVVTSADVLLLLLLLQVQGWRVC
jgi:hypothetical protein